MGSVVRSKDKAAIPNTLPSPPIGRPHLRPTQVLYGYPVKPFYPNSQTWLSFPANQEPSWEGRSQGPCNRPHQQQSAPRGRESIKPHLTEADGLNLIIESRRGVRGLGGAVWFDSSKEKPGSKNTFFEERGERAE